MRHRARWVSFVLLVAWLALGPVGMAFDPCGALMALTDTPCGAASVLIDTVPSRTPLALAAVVAAATPDTAPPARPRALDPPPKLLVLSA